MRRIALLVIVAALVAASGAFAQNRSLGARRLIIDNGAGANTYVTSANGLGVSVLPAYLPSACAILDLNANTSGAAKLGFLGPRVAEVDKINICGGTPPAGMLIYNSTFNYYEYFNGAVWAPVVSGWSLHGNGSTIPPAAATTPAPINPGDYFLGTLDAVDFTIVTNSAQRVRVEGDDPVNGNTVEILNDGALSTGLKIYANGGTGINIDPASTGIVIDATLTGIEFAGSQPGTGIDMANGASLTGMVIDNTPFGIEIGSGAPGGQGIGVNATVNGITVGNITAPNDGLDVNATSTGMLVGTLTQPNFGLDVDAAITGATFDAPVIGIDVGQSTSPVLGVGVQAVTTGVDVNMAFGGGTAINTFDIFGTGINMQQIFGTGINMQAINGTGMFMQHIGTGVEDGISVLSILTNRGITLQGIASNLGLDITGYTTSIVTDGPSTFGDGGGADNHTFNMGIGDMTVNLAGGASDLILNGIDQVVPVGPHDQFLYLNAGNIVDQTPVGTNVVTGSGTLNTIPLWTPDGFTLGNSIITQEANASGINVSGANVAASNVVEINNQNNTSTAVKINAAGGVGVDIDPASTGIIIDATATGIDYQGSNPTTGINLRATTTGINYVNAPNTGMNLQATTIGINVGSVTQPNTALQIDATQRGEVFLDGPTFTASTFFQTATSSIAGYEAQIGGAGNMSEGGFYANTTPGSTGDMGAGFELATLGDNVVTNGAVFLRNNSAAATADWNAGVNIVTTGGGDITTGIIVNDAGGTGVIPTGINLLNVGTGITITSLGGTSITGNQNFISTGGFGRFANGVATNTAAPNPLGNQITWSNGNSGTLSTQVLTAPRTWLLPDETGVLDAYDPLNNNGFVYFQPEVPQVASAAGSYGNNNLISLRGLATTPNGIVVDLTTNPLAGSGVGVIADVTVSGVSDGIGMYGRASTSGTGFARGIVSDGVALPGSAANIWGGNFGANSPGASASNLIGTLTYASGGGSTGSVTGAWIRGFGGAGSSVVDGIVADAFGANASVATGVRVTTNGSTTQNIGVGISATGIGSIGVDVNAGSRTGMRITDVDVAGASTGIFMDKTTGGTQTAGIDINNASLVAGSTISDGILIRRANNGAITNGMRVVGAVTDYVAADAATTNTGFSSLLSGQVGFNSQATSGTGFQATALTSGTGFNAAVNGGGDGFSASVSGGATGRGVISTNTSTATGSKAGAFVGNNSNVPGATNVALQVERGDLTVGRESGAQGAGVVVVETGINEGPSGVVSAAFSFPIQPATSSGTSFANVVVVNQHARTNSIILITGLDGSQSFISGDQTFSFHVTNRANGSFEVAATRHTTGGQGAGLIPLRFGYLIINPDR